MTKIMLEKKNDSHFLIIGGFSFFFFLTITFFFNLTSYSLLGWDCVIVSMSLPLFLFVCTITVI